MNQAPSPNTVIDRILEDAPHSDLKDKREVRDMKEKELSSALSGEKNLLDALKRQMSSRDQEVDRLKQQYEETARTAEELEEKLSSQNKANAETNMVSCFSCVFLRMGLF